jgi:hypothetical protein
LNILFFNRVSVTVLSKITQINPNIPLQDKEDQSDRQLLPDQNNIIKNRMEKEFARPKQATSSIKVREHFHDFWIASPFVTVGVQRSLQHLPMTPVCCDRSQSK